MNKDKKIGKIIIPGNVRPEAQELETAHILAEAGFDIEFLQPSYVKGVFLPDILLNGQIWEIKSPCGNNKLAIEKHFKKAQKQAANVIFDIRRIGFSERSAILKIKRELSMRCGKIKQVKIITKNNKILDFLR
ncbi:MAG: hypothetical protein LBB23_03580 [Rickettsiales bacterium]|jgi:hypothetical protein|nr:hypothetical protein [Rickettsiales bacterium]